MRLNRRRFLTASAGAAAALPFLSHRRAAGQEALIPDPNGILDLPAGYSYRVIEASLNADDPFDPNRPRMTDGFLVPGLPDGMACHDGGDTWILMRNHELSVLPPDDGLRPFLSPYDGDRTTAPVQSFVDDPAYVGGVSRVVVDKRTLERVSSNLVLVGTVRNCAGGPHPDGWLTCEETTIEGHGWVFLTSKDADGLQMPRRIPAYGRFNHEAVAFDPESGVAWLTEDRGDSVLYRYVPDDPADAFGPGRLQAMRVVGVDTYDTSANMQVGDRLEVDWIDLDDTDAPDDDLRLRAAAAGAATIARGEGIWRADTGEIYVVSTSGGAAGKGQVFRLVPGAPDTLELVAMPNDETVLDGPDNCCVAPWGDVYLAEDGGGDQFIRVLRPNGEVTTLARNAMPPLLPGGGSSELAGVCFSPDGSTLFVNIQVNGVTLAIQGPFEDAPGSSGEGGGCRVGPAPDGVGGLALGAAGVAAAAAIAGKTRG